MKLEDKYPNLFTPLDDEEAELMRAIDNDEFVTTSDSKEAIKTHIKTAKNTLKKKGIPSRLQ